MVGRKAQNIRKVEVQADQAASFADTYLENRLVSSAPKTFRPDGLNIMTGLIEKMNGSRTEILVQFELHAALIPGKSTKRSRLISAPYAMAAKTSSRWSWGY